MFDCASACRRGNYPTIFKDLDANHFNRKANDTEFGVTEVVFDISQYGYCSGLLHTRPLCTRTPYTPLGKVAVAFL